MGEEFTVEGVRVVAQAVADYLKGRGLARRGVVVGYDARANSEGYAKACMEVLAGNDITVYREARDVPTPVVAFAVARLRAGGGIMITASHNPPAYNGIKFIPHYGGPATTEVTSELEHLIAEARVEALDLMAAERRGLVVEAGFGEEYVEWAASLVDADSIRRAKLRVLVNALHGSARGYLERALKAVGCEVECMRCERDPNFGGLTPDPTSPESVEDMASMMGGFHVGVATDGDGDRVAAYSKQLVTPNVLFPIVLSHLFRKGVKGGVVRTVATTHMVDEVASRSGARLYEVPVGFKNIAPHLLMGEAVMGGEESGGFGYKWHVPEKDGIISSLYVVEALACSGRRSIEELLSDLRGEFRLLHGVRGSVGVGSREAFKEALSRFEPREACGRRVINTVRIDGVKLVVDGGWLLIRPSGTEPLVRVYAEACEPSLAEELLSWGLSKVREMSSAG